MGEEKFLGLQTRNTKKTQNSELHCTAGEGAQRKKPASPSEGKKNKKKRDSANHGASWEKIVSFQSEVIPFTLSHCKWKERVEQGRKGAGSPNEVGVQGLFKPSNDTSKPHFETILQHTAMAHRRGPLERLCCCGARGAGPSRAGSPRAAANTHGVCVRLLLPTLEKVGNAFCDSLGRHGTCDGSGYAVSIHAQVPPPMSNDPSVTKKLQCEHRGGDALDTVFIGHRRSFKTLNRVLRQFKYGLALHT